MGAVFPAIAKGIALLWSSTPAILKTILITVGTNIALTKVSKLLGPKAPKVRDFPADIEYSDTMASRRVLYGENKVSGMNVIPPLVTGSDGEYLHQVLAIAGHEVNAIGTVFFDKTALTLDGSGNVTGGAFNGKATIRKYTGTATQTVDGILNSALAEWTSDHRGRGVAYLALRYQYDTEVYRSGKPDVTAIVQGKKCYDPRLDTSPGANPTDATYAAYTTNPALCLADYLLASYGLSESAARVDWSLVVAAANICDEDVAIPGSTTQKRFTCNLVLDAISNFETNIEAIALAMMGTCYYSGGKWRMYAGAWSSSAFTITADNVIGELSIQTAASRKSDGYYNAVRGRFIDKDRDYQPLEFEPILNSTYENEDGNERIYTEVDFPACNNQYEAQRNAIILSKQSRRQKTVTVVCDFSAYKIRPWETGVATIAEVGWSNQPVRCVGWRFRPEPAIELTLQEAASTDYDDPDPGDYVTPASVATTAPATYRPGTPQSFTATQEIESILLQWQAPTNTVPGVLYRLYEHTASTPFSSATLIYEGADTQHRVPRTDTNTRYYWVRSFYRGSGGQSDETPSGAGLSSSGKIATGSAYLTNEATALEADSGGTVSDFSTAVGFFKVFSGPTDVTSSATFAVVSQTNVTGEINTADDTPVSGQVKGYYRVTAMTGDQGVLKISATYGGTTFTKDFTVTKVRDGADGATAGIFLSVTGLAIPADNDGSNPVFTNASTTVTVYEGQVDESANWTVTASPSTGITGSLATRTYTLTGMTVDTGYVEFTATRSGYDPLVVRLSVTKVRAGATGPEGPAGDVGGFSAVLSTDAVTLMAYADGTVISFAPAEGQFNVFLGQENLTGSAVFSANAIDCTGTINTAADTPVSGKPKGYYRVTAMTADTASLELTASLTTDLGNILMEDGFRIMQEDGTSTLQTEGSFSITKVFSLAKSKVGYEIVSSLPSTDLFEGRIVFLTTDDKLYRYDGSNWIAAVSASDVTGQLTNSQIADIAAAKLTGTITETQIGDNSISTAKLQAGSVSTAALAAGAVTADTIASNAVTAAKVSAGAIEANALATNSVTSDKIFAGAVTAAKISVTNLASINADLGSITAGNIVLPSGGFIRSGQTAFNTGTGFYIGNDSGTPKFSFGNPSGKHIKWDGTNLEINGGIVTDASIANGEISAGKFATNIKPIEIFSTLPAAGTEGRIVYLTTDDKLYRDTGSAWVTAVPASDITGTLQDAQIAALAASKVTGQLSDSQLAAIAAAKVTGQITGTQITDGAISTAKLQAGAVTTATLAAGAVTADTIASNAITSAKISAGAVETAKLAAGAVVANTIASNAVIASKISAGAVEAAAIATNAVTSDKIFAGAVTAAKISVTDLAAINANMGNITAGTIVLPSGGFIRSGQTAYNTGTGFYLGNDGGTPKFSIGNSAGKNIRWDGSDLTINGGIVTTNSIIDGAVSSFDYDLDTTGANLTNNVATTVASATVTTIASKAVKISVYIEGQTTWDFPSVGSGGNTTLTIKRDATTLVTYVFFGPFAPWQFTRFYIDTPAAGTYTYSVTVQPAVDALETNKVLNFSYAALEVEQIKR